MDSNNLIGDYYKNKCIFITGVTGFIGKLLVEKLLCSCPDIKNIYCLIREKNGNTAEHRLNELIACKVRPVRPSSRYCIKRISNLRLGV